MALFFSERNSYWNKRFKENGEIYGAKHSKVLEEIINHLDKKDKILELAGSYGRNAFFLANLGFNVICTDISENAIKIAKEKYVHPNIIYEVKNALNLDYSNNYFDVVLSIYGMNVFSKDELNKVFKQSYNILKLNGKFINTFLSVDDAEYATGERIDKDTFLIDNSRQLVKFFREEEIKQLHESNGFRITHLLKREEKRNIKDQILESKFYLVIANKV